MGFVAPFGLALVLLVLTSWGAGMTAMIRTSLALLFNWCAQVVYYRIFGDSVPWAFSMWLDTITATIILARPAGKMQAVIGLTFLFQIAMHTAYGLDLVRHGYVYEAAYNYWKMLRNIAILQIVLAGVWFLDGMARRILGGRYTRHIRWYSGVAETPSSTRVV